MSKGRPAGVLANEIVKIFDWRNPLPLQGIPRGEASRQQLGVAFDDLAHSSDPDRAERMRELARRFVPWLASEELEALIDRSLAGSRRWSTPDEIREMAELFELAEADRDSLGIHQIRSVHPDGRAFDDADMKARRRVANKLLARERRRQAALTANSQQERSALTDRELLFLEKYRGEWQSSTAIAQAVRRSHRYDGTRNLVSLRKAVNRATERFKKLGLIEEDVRKGSNGQPLNFVRLLIVHAKNVTETPRHAENTKKTASLRRRS
jgi:hypothetical protein